MSDIFYPGQCPFCCEICANFIAANTSIIVTFSGLTACPCYTPSSGSTIEIISAINGSFTVPRVGVSPTWNYDLVITNGATVKQWTGPNCTGTSSTTQVDMEVSAGCVTGTGRTLGIDLIIKAPFTYQLFAGNTPSGLFTPKSNQIAGTGCNNITHFPSNPVFGGFGTVSI